MKDFLKSFSFRFFISFFILSLFFLFFGGYYFLEVMQRYFEEELNEKLIGIGKILASNFDVNFLIKNEEFLKDGKYLKYLKEKLKKNMKELNLKRLYIFNFKGESIVDTEDMPYGTLLGIFLIYPSAIENLKKGKVYTTLLYKVKGEYYKSAFIPIYGKLGFGIEISAEYIKNIRDLQIKIGIFFILCLLISLVFSYYLSKYISNPLKKLIKETDKLVESDFEEKINFISGTELDKLGNALEILRKKINQRDQYLKMMVSQIAHEIKNPLSIYNFYLSFLLDDGIKIKEKLEYINILKEETKKIEELLDNFINFVKKKEPNFEFFFLKDLFSQIEKFYLKKAQEQKIEISNEVSDVLKIYSDKDFLFHILFNLVKNSFEAVENCGKITLYGKEEEGFYIISVKDSGKGIEKEILNKVFEPFFTTKPKGIGLGLTIVEEYTKKLKGKLMLNSEEGLGTEVLIYLPKRRNYGNINS